MCVARPTSRDIEDPAAVIDDACGRILTHGTAAERMRCDFAPAQNAVSREKGLAAQMFDGAPSSARPPFKAGIFP